MGSKLRGTFAVEIRELLWAHGDSVPPQPETVDLLEDILFEFITDTSQSVQKVAGARARTRVDDIKFVYRHDPVLLGRICEILQKQEQVRRARASMTTDFNEMAKLGEISDDVDSEDDGAPPSAQPLDEDLDDSA